MKTELVALAGIGLAWLTNAAGQEPANNEKDPILLVGPAFNTTARLSQAVKEFRSAKTPTNDITRSCTTLLVTLPCRRQRFPFW